ncbi:hypothetical protein BD324DRAFT_638058 [Kockovaella imperatae]|uniref:Zn(2)-C6 fungal-type domain-containing protein n=1 Tax=Kockovaella imperatae TaxID=4999 RepID=A0A1Y1U7N5_9TREE|nr:hypothetical protein BD324DRAFT_638058 [Kockovaella imperatae]ORX34022.1 hypothetical protein BD324DRAFT_638058 [Kockovaella imperatae]
MACTFCRRRKLRCSGEKPICSMCIKYKQQCEYIPPPKKPGKRKSQRARPDPRAPAQSQKPTPTHSPDNDQVTHPSSNTIPPSQPSHVYHPPSGNVDFSNGVPYINPLSMTAPMPTSFVENTTQSDTSAFFDADVSGQYSFSNNVGGAFPANGMYDSNSNGYHQTQLSDLTSWNGYNLDMQDNMSWPNASFPSMQSSVDLQTPVIASQSTPQQQYMPNFQTPLGISPHVQLQRNIDLNTTPFAPSPFLNSSNSLQTVIDTPTAPEPSFRFPAHVSGDSTFSTPSDDNQPLALPSLPPSTHNSAESPSIPDLSGLAAAEVTHVTNTSRIDPIEGITERLGEFLFNPKERQDVGSNDYKRRRPKNGQAFDPDRRDSLVRLHGVDEHDGLTDEVREILLDCFLAHSKLFFHMSIPRFRYRLQFTDRRRPSLALLNAMYLWATRMSSSPNMGEMEQTFFDNACRALDLNSANGDRLIDCLRAAMLLSAWSFVSGRFHEGWIISGMAVRLVLSTGLHQIKSCVFAPEVKPNPFLRSKVHLLPPLEDSIELAERIHTFWAVFVVDRCGAAATGFPAGINVEDITTPFPRPLEDIVAGSVTRQDDITVKDIYRPAYFQPLDDMWYAKFCRAITVLERASKLALLEADDESEHTRQWSIYQLNPSLPRPPAWLEQPKYRCLADYRETKLGLEQMTSAMGADGVFPLDRIRNAELDGAELPYISPKNIMLHHQYQATHMLLHDINSLECENQEALASARRSAALVRQGPALPSLEVDSFTITVWSIVAKVLVKEIRRLFLLGDRASALVIENDVNVFIQEMNNVGLFMQLARTQAKAVEEMRDSAKRSITEEDFSPLYKPRDIKGLHQTPRTSRTGSDDKARGDNEPTRMGF